MESRPVDEKTRYREMLAEVRRKRDQLLAGSRVGAELSEDLLSTVESWIEKTDVRELAFSPLPPLVSVVEHLPDASLLDLGSDLDLVLRHADPASEQAISQFLRARSGQSRLWYGGLLDMWARASVLKQGLPAQFDYPLPNGRNNDIRLEMQGRVFHFENTVITEDDESIEVWDRFIQDKRIDPEKVLVRPGPYCPPSAKGPSPYYDALRIYAKVYDKIAKNLKPDKSQCAPGAPNILLLSFAGWGVWPDDHGVSWALDELFADQPKIGGRIANAPPHLIDISLGAWIDFTTDELVRAGGLSVNDFCKNYDRIVAAPRKLSGILLMKGCTLVSARLNYNADRECRISHAEMAAFEKLFSAAPSYEIQ